MGAGEGFKPGTQRVGRVCRAHQKKVLRMKTEFQKSCRRDLALLEGGKILADPESIFLLRLMLQASLQHECSKTDRCSAICLACEHLMQRSEPQTSSEACIGFGMTERGKPLAMRRLESRLYEGAFESGQPFGVA